MNCQPRIVNARNLIQLYAIDEPDSPFYERLAPNQDVVRYVILMSEARAVCGGWYVLVRRQEP